jgi:cytochrome c biogenesis protein CcmG/thiol:disulfide interchange protein DsbE
MRTEEEEATGEPAATAGPAAARRGAHTIRWVMLGLGAGLVVAVAILASQLGKDATYVPTPLIGKAAPAFTFTALDGTKVTNADFAGKPYVVNFWASWCVPCRREHGTLRAFWERYRDKGVALLGVLYEDTPERAREFQQDLGGDWPLIKENRQAVVDFGVRGPPETYVVDGQGIIVAKFTGPVGPGQLEAALALDARSAGR